MSLSCVSVQYVAELLHEQGQPIVSTCSAADVQAAFNTIVTRIQRLWVTYMHTNTRIGWMTQAIRWCDLFFSSFNLILLNQSSPNDLHVWRLLGRELQDANAHAAVALGVWTHSIKIDPYSHEKLKFSVFWIHLLGCHLLRMSRQWETRLSQVALSNFFSPLFSWTVTFQHFTHLLLSRRACSSWDHVTQSHWC